MKEIIKYEDDKGKVWDTKEQAIKSDSINIIKVSLQEHASEYHCFNTVAWIDELKVQPEVVRHLLKLLGIDDTKLAIEKLYKDMQVIK